MWTFLSVQQVGQLLHVCGGYNQIGVLVLHDFSVKGETKTRGDSSRRLIRLDENFSRRGRNSTQQYTIEKSIRSSNFRLLEEVILREQLV